MAEPEIEGSSEGIFAKLKLGCSFQPSDEVKYTLEGVQNQRKGRGLFLVYGNTSLKSPM